MKTTTEHLVYEATRSAGALTYVPTRYPYTYACDFMRQFPRVIPVDAGRVPDGMSRSDATEIRQRWAEIERRTDEDLAIALADAYLQVHGIERREYS
jgi:hypothetical protein